jgi:hypothetical protein
MSRKTLLAVAWFFASAVAALAAPPRWPTLQQQLAKDGVVPGSALERLIQANQDFRLLRREETKDGLGIPLWLRVLWRKSHPELEHSAGDPTGGYPRVLREIHAWMLAHQDLLPGPPEQSVLPSPNRTVVGTNLRISGAQTAPRSGSDIRIDSWHPQRIIAASNNILASGQQGQYWSGDGGTSWGQTLLPLVTGDSHQSNPTVDWDSNGSAWATTLGVVVDSNSNTIASRLRTYKSTNGGQTWTFDSLASGSQTAVDKQRVWVDHSATSPYHDTLYAIWYNTQPAVMNRKLPGGNWDIPIQVSGAETKGMAIGGDVTTNAYGDVFGFWPDTGGSSYPPQLLFTKSTNGGASYSAPVTIAPTFGSYEIAVPAFASKALMYVSAGAWRTAAKNMVYASWTDLSGEIGCTTGAQAPGANVASLCKTRIWFSRSANGGTTWSTPVKINNQSCPTDQFNQRMVVDETTGTLGIIYYDTISDPGRKKADVWYQASFDDGATWYPPVRLTSAQTDETVAGADPSNQYGDYNGLSASAHVLFPSWTDRRNNAREEIWTARVDEFGALAYHSAVNPPAMDNPLCGRLQVFACDMDRNLSSSLLGRAYIVGLNGGTTLEEPNQILVAAFGPAGNLSWSRTYGLGDARAVAVDSQGAVVVATTTGVLRLSGLNGNLLASYPISGWIPEKMALDPSDNVYVTGYDVMTRQAYTVRLDKSSTGSLTLSPGWPQRFGLASPVIGLSEGRAIVVKGSAVYVAGTVITSSSIWQDAMILKYSLTGGAPAAQFFYDGSVEYQSEDALNDLAVDSGGNVFATGYASGIYESAGSDFDYLTLRLNSSSFGAAVWVKRFDAGRLFAGRIVYLSTDKATSLALDPAGQSVFVTGSSNLNGNTDIRTLKYGAADGATMSDWRFDSTANDTPSGLFVSSAGQVFVGGLSGNRFTLLAQSGDLLSAQYGTPSFIATTTMSGGISGTPPTVACLAGRNTLGAPALFSGGFYRNDCLCDPIAATGIQWVYP